MFRDVAISTNLDVHREAHLESKASYLTPCREQKFRKRWNQLPEGRWQTELNTGEDGCRLVFQKRVRLSMTVFPVQRHLAADPKQNQLLVNKRIFVFSSRSLEEWRTLQSERKSPLDKRLACPGAQKAFILDLRDWN